MSTIVKEKGSVKHVEKAKCEISEERIAEKAYQLWLNRGCEHGHDVQDWLQAEEELRIATTSSQ